MLNSLLVNNTRQGPEEMLFHVSPFVSLVVGIGLKICDCKAKDVEDTILKSAGRISFKSANKLIYQFLPLNINSIHTCIRRYHFLSVFLTVLQEVLQN